MINWLWRRSFGQILVASWLQSPKDHLFLWLNIIPHGRGGVILWWWLLLLLLFLVPYGARLSSFSILDRLVDCWKVKSKLTFKLTSWGMFLHKVIDPVLILPFLTYNFRLFELWVHNEIETLSLSLTSQWTYNSLLSFCYWIFLVIFQDLALKLWCLPRPKALH